MGKAAKAGTKNKKEEEPTKAKKKAKVRLFNGAIYLHALWSKRAMPSFSCNIGAYLIFFLLSSSASW